MSDTRRSYDAQELVNAIDRYIETRYIGAAVSINNKHAKAARERLIQAVVRATGNPEPE